MDIVHDGVYGYERLELEPRTSLERDKNCDKLKNRIYGTGENGIWQILRCAVCTGRCIEDKARKKGTKYHVTLSVGKR